MQVIHIVPSLFEYFTDIKELAFELIDAINVEGVEAEPVVFEVSPPTRAEQARILDVAPNIRPTFTKEMKVEQVVDEFAGYDLVHLHCPFFGGAGKILKWKQAHPEKPLLVTYYHDLAFTDLFSLWVRWYNAYYLPKLFTVADMVTCFSADDFNHSHGRYWLNDSRKLFPLGGSLNFTPLTDHSYEVKLHDKEEIVANILAAYQMLI
ncbi:MAG: glycosyltransferase [bacterium]|nr:glycosyltransferase [bacterium]